MANEKYAGNVDLARADGYDFKYAKLDSEFEARGMEQKLMDYFGGPTYGRSNETWGTMNEADGLLNKVVSWKWSRGDKRAKQFRAAYANEDLFEKTMSALFD